MKHITLIINCLFLFLVFSCNNESKPDQEPEIIRIDIKDNTRKQLNLSDLHTIPLETNKKSLIGDVGRSRFFNNRFYILNKNRFKKPTLFAFDTKGKLINKTKIGKGPGEVIEPFAFAINQENSTIVLHDQAQNPSFVYDLDLNFKSKIKHDYIFNYDFYHIAKDTFLVYHHIPKVRDHNPSEEDCYSYTLYTEGFTKAKHLEILVHGDQRIHLHTPVSIRNKEVYFVAPYNYNIYQLLNGESLVRYTLDFGNLSFSTNELKTMSDDDYRDFISSGKRAAVGGIYKSKEFLVILTVIDGKAYTFFRSLKNGEIYCLNDLIDSNLLPSDLLLWGVTNDGSFYGLLEPEQMLEFQKSSGKFKEYDVDENDNPYIFLFKVREPK